MLWPSATPIDVRDRPLPDECRQRLYKWMRIALSGKGLRVCNRAITFDNVIVAIAAKDGVVATEAQQCVIDAAAVDGVAANLVP